MQEPVLFPSSLFVFFEVHANSFAVVCLGNDSIAFSCVRNLQTPPQQCFSPKQARQCHNANARQFVVDLNCCLVVLDAVMAW